MNRLVSYYRLRRRFYNSIETVKTTYVPGTPGPSQPQRDNQMPVPPRTKASPPVYEEEKESWVPNQNLQDQYPPDPTIQNIPEDNRVRKEEYLNLILPELITLDPREKAEVLRERI